jgi:predicted flap endonuclease-1-like 5' DNA nuclease
MAAVTELSDSEVPETEEIGAVPAAEVEAEESDSTGIAARIPTGLEYIEGIGPAYAQKLKEIGVNTPEQLLHWGANPRGRQAIAERSEISSKLILKWVNQIDLYRVKGIGSEYAELLEQAGVDTVVELATRNPANLYQTLVAVNEAKKLVRKLPVISQVEDWVNQAKNLPRVVSY